MRWAWALALLALVVAGSAVPAAPGDRLAHFKELARRWYPRVYFASPEKKGGHRALADITESIRELRYYRAAVFVPQPGPDSETARALSAEIVAAAE